MLQELRASPRGENCILNTESDTIACTPPRAAARRSSPQPPNPACNAITCRPHSVSVPSGWTPSAPRSPVFTTRGELGCAALLSARLSNHNPPRLESPPKSCGPPCHAGKLEARHPHQGHLMKSGTSWSSHACTSSSDESRGNKSLQDKLPNLLSTLKERSIHQKKDFVSDASPSLLDHDAQKPHDEHSHMTGTSISSCLFPLKGGSMSLPPRRNTLRTVRDVPAKVPALRCASQSPAALPLRQEHGIRHQQGLGVGLAMNSEQMEARSLKCIPGAALMPFGTSPKEVAKLVQVISLGNSCGTKISIRRTGLDEATLPFDWMRSSIDGLLHWLEHDFEGFCEAEHQYHLIQQDCAMTVFRSRTHSFWHDDLTDVATLEKLHRRVDRFLGLASDLAHENPRSLLFVRSVACSGELPRIEALLEVLRKRFESPGRKVFLLVIIDGQPFKGPVLHTQERNHLLFWLQPTFSGPLSSDCSMAAPYEEAIAFAVHRIIVGPSEVQERNWLHVQCATDIVKKDGPLWQLGVRSTDSGLWVGKVLLSGASVETMFAAFEGIDEEDLSKGTEASMPAQHQINSARLGA